MKKGNVINVFQDGKFYRCKKGLVVSVDSKRVKVSIPEIDWNDGEWFERKHKSGAYTCQDGWNEWIYTEQNPKKIKVFDDCDYQKFLKLEDLVVFDEINRQITVRKW